MKKNRTTRLIVLVLFLAIVTAVIISGTFAKYTTSVNGNGTAEVAAWSFKATGLDGSTITTVALTDTTLNSKVKDGAIAPGTDGSFGVKIDASGSEVAVDYTIIISDLHNQPKNLKFYSDSSFSSQLVAEADGSYKVTGNIALTNVGTPVTVPVYWKWDFVTDSSTDADDNGELDTDTQDTLDAGKDMTFKVTIVGTQADPTK